MDYIKLVNYAIYWSGTDNGRNRQDGRYPHGSDDCTYFASSAMREGGWPTVGTNIFNRGDNSKWDYYVQGTSYNTYTWGGSPNLASFSVVSNRTAWLPSIWDGLIGDLLFEDWDPNGRADGTIDHSQIYTARDSNGMPYISQHTNWRSNIPLSMSIQLSQQQGHTSIVYYGRRT